MSTTTPRAREIITALAEHTNEMSDAQFRKHWSEFLYQALEMQTEEIISHIDNLKMKEVRKGITKEGQLINAGFNTAIRSYNKSINELIVKLK